MPLSIAALVVLATSFVATDATLTAYRCTLLTPPAPHDVQQPVSRFDPFQSRPPLDTEALGWVSRPGLSAPDVDRYRARRDRAALMMRRSLWSTVVSGVVTGAGISLFIADSNTSDQFFGPGAVAGVGLAFVGSVGLFGSRIAARVGLARYAGALDDGARLAGIRTPPSVAAGVGLAVLFPSIGSGVARTAEREIDAALERGMRGVNVAFAPVLLHRGAGATVSVRF